MIGILAIVGASVIGLLFYIGLFWVLPMAGAMDDKEGAMMVGIAHAIVAVAGWGAWGIAYLAVN